MEPGHDGVDPAGRSRDWGAMIIGVVLVGIGAYVLLKDTFKVELPDIDWGGLWPVLLMLLGLAILLRAGSGRTRRRGR